MSHENAKKVKWEMFRKNEYGTYLNAQVSTWYI